MKKATDAIDFIAICHQPIAIEAYDAEHESLKADVKKWARTAVSQGKLIRFDHKWHGVKTLGEGKTLMSTAGLAQAALNEEGEAPIFGGLPHKVSFDATTCLLMLTHTRTPEVLAEDPAVSEAWQSMNIAAQALDRHTQWQGEQVYLYNEQHQLSLVYASLEGKALDRMMKEVGAVTAPTVDDSPRVQTPAPEPKQAPTPAPAVEAPVEKMNVFTMTPAAGEFTREQYLAIDGWSDELLVSEGLMTIESVEVNAEVVVPPPAPAAPEPAEIPWTIKPTPEGFTLESYTDSGWTMDQLIAAGLVEQVQPATDVAVASIDEGAAMNCPQCAVAMDVSGGVHECPQCGHLEA